MTPEPSLRHLIGRLAVLDARVRVAVERFRALDPDPDDGFRGLYVSDEKVDSLLEHGRHRADPGPGPHDELLLAVEASADDAAGAGERLRLREVIHNFGLHRVDVEVLLAALAPDLEPRFEKLYGYLHDDVTRRRASPGLALELAGVAVTDGAARSRLRPGAAVFSRGLLTLEESSRPFLTRSLRVPDRVTAFLLGDDAPDHVLVGGLIDAPPVPGELTDRLARALAAGGDLVALRQTRDVGASGVAVAAFASVGKPAITVDVSIPVEAHEVDVVLDAVIREARLRGAGIVVEGVDALEGWAIRRLTADGTPLVLIGSRPWDPTWADRTPFAVEAPGHLARLHAGRWAIGLDGDAPDDLGAITEFRLGPRQIDQAIAAAHTHAAAHDRRVTLRDLAVGAKAQNSAGLERLARRIEPSARWDQMVLRNETRAQLEHLRARVAHRGTVLDSWGLRRGGGRGEGITALFAGESGTGKTMAAEVIAGDLGLDLYVIDLATVVDKYIGETEKNLERIFSEAEGVNGVLFFDEADALFGNRSEVNDARDRYANVEVAYLLQRVEAFDGLAILATNLKANIDEAFSRRISVVVDFPEPEVDERRKLWSVLLGDVPLAADVDLDFCARAFELSGGNIRNVAVAAAYLAAADDSVVTMRHVIQGTQIEYRKLGRLTVEAEFGDWSWVLDLDRADAGT